MLVPRCFAQSEFKRVKNSRYLDRSNSLNLQFAQLDTPYPFVRKHFETEIHPADASTAPVNSFSTGRIQNWWPSDFISVRFMTI